MDIQPQKNQTQSISDDQALAKVLSGVSTEPDAPEPAPTMPTPTQMPNPSAPNPPANDTPAEEPEEVTETPEPVNLPTPPAESPGQSNDLDSIKKDALQELRPLVGKLNLPPEEQFDTYLLLLRSTDDKALIAPAHAAAQSITDESKKAQALLEIIKEIDFLSSSQAAGEDQPAPVN